MLGLWLGLNGRISLYTPEYLHIGLINVSE